MNIPQRSTAMPATASAETTNVPPSLLCKRTGEAAGLTACTCDACLWVQAMERDFAEEEVAEDA